MDSGFRLRAPGTLTPAKRLNFDCAPGWFIGLTVEWLIGKRTSRSFAAEAGKGSG